MKSFGMQFTDPDGKGSLEHRKVAKERSKFVYYQQAAGSDTPFQKGLAYWSYYTLVFTTFCTLTPDLVRNTLEPVVKLVS